MSRLLTLLMIIMLVIVPSSMVSAAICQHQSPVEHALARADSDARVANVARSEETAASHSKKATLFDAPAVFLLADMLPTAQLTPPLGGAEPIRRSLLDEGRLPGTSLRPLLEPPAA